ncbi:MAG TPA: lysophospholipid acyltransferase family protein [Anaerolineales bacterium]|nr:lysophospholipid acyltransferase family protein [Anaerolineales bacterium]
MQRKLIRAIARLLFKLFARLEVTGLENVPTQGGCILAVNHLGRLDPPLVFAMLDRDDVTSLVADKYLHHPFFRWIVNAVNGIWINREEADFNALRAARSFLLAGGVLGIAPEGTRSHTGALIAAKTGVAYLADKAGVPIVPVAISGTEKAVRELLRLRRQSIKIRFGKPMRLPPLERGDRTAALQRNTDEIMCQIAAMLPPQYRGVYADHPRLKELITA